jgi:hypothetical protein
MAFAGVEGLNLCLHGARIVDERVFWMANLMILGLVWWGMAVRLSPTCKVAFGALPSLGSRARSAETFDAARRYCDA